MTDTAAAQPTYPDVIVQLTGQNGNAYAIIGAVSKALRRAGYTEAAEQFPKDAMDQPSYDALLVPAMNTVNVE